MWISIPKRHIVVWDSIAGYIRQAELDQVMAPFVNMVPYFLIECAANIEEHCKYSLALFTYESANAPQCRHGDCCIFTLKYIKCHSLGLPFPIALHDKNIKAIREKMTVVIFEKIPDGHKSEISDIDVNQDIRLPPDDFHQTTSRRLSDDFQTTSKRLPDDFQTNFRQLPDDFQTTSRRLPNNFLMTSKRLPDDFHQTTSRQFLDYFQTTYKRLINDFKTTYQKSSRRSVLTMWSCMNCFFAV
ncbi:hypothetical protein N665_1273s0009 [Sinapis alba]|nr:hypothetical protein N665_1273s0009 [Sinapis alba]